MQLQDALHSGSSESRLSIIPLMGFPGIQLNHTTLKQNVFNWEVQFRTLAALIKRFEPDGMFTLMDLSVEANALGLPVHFPLDETPTVERAVVCHRSDLERFRHIDILADGRAHMYCEVLRRLRQHFDILCGGYVIGPYTLAALMMGATEAALATLDSPDLLHEILQLATRVVRRYAQGLIEAGAHTLMILEPSAVMLSPAAFCQFSGDYVRQLIDGMGIPWILHICGNTTHLIPQMAATGVAGLSLDALVDLTAIAEHIPSEVMIMGNVNPVATMLQQSPQAVYQETHRLVEAMHAHPNFILSTGCDLPPETPLANIEAFMSAGRAGR
jgi:uroporphyrinogen decarboxylase